MMRSIIGIVIVTCHVTLMICAVIGCYCTARFLRHLPAHRIPYISDTGVHSPEKYIFRQVLNTATITGICLIITRYVVVKATNEQNGRNRKIAGLSIFSCVVGVLATCSMSLVANFPECGDLDGDGISITHTVGAVLLFLFGSIFAAMDCALTLLLRTSRSQNATCTSIGRCGWIRFTLALLVFGNALVGAVFIVKDIKEDANLCPKDNSTHPSPNYSPSGINYDASAACEWIHSSLFLIYYLTLAPEFSDYSIELTAIPHQTTTHEDTTDQAAAASTAAAAAAATGGQVPKFAAPVRQTTEHSPLLKTV